jgi:hypothetical protein
MVFPSPRSNDPPSKMVVSGVNTPASRAAIAVIGLKVEPVGYRPWIARLESGAPLSSSVSAR